VPKPFPENGQCQMHGGKSKSAPRDEKHGNHLPTFPTAVTTAINAILW
jgi:hypothetical protein